MPTTSPTHTETTRMVPVDSLSYGTSLPGGTQGSRTRVFSLNKGIAALHKTSSHVDPSSCLHPLHSLYFLHPLSLSTYTWWRYGAITGRAAIDLSLAYFLHIVVVLSASSMHSPSATAFLSFLRTPHLPFQRTALAGGYRKIGRRPW